MVLWNGTGRDIRSGYSLKGRDDPAYIKELAGLHRYEK